MPSASTRKTSSVTAYGMSGRAARLSASATMSALDRVLGGAQPAVVRLLTVLPSERAARCRDADRDAGPAGRRAAVDLQDGAGDEARLIRRQEGDRSVHVVGRPVATDGNGLEHRLPVLQVGGRAV